MAENEVRLMAVARYVDAEGERWLRPVENVDWHKAFDSAITEEDVARAFNPGRILDRIEARGKIVSAFPTERNQ